MKLETIFAIVRKYDDSANFCGYHDDPEKLAIVANWNKSELSNVESYLCKHYGDVDLVFDDSVCACSECGLLVETQATHYGWLPEFYHGDGYLMCKTCAEKDDFSDYIEQIINDSNHANVLMTVEQLENKGFENMNGTFENGFYHGQNDDPKQILKDHQEKYPDHDFIFNIDHTGQFDTHFKIYGRKIENN